jgi:uncharacterized membrane protein YfcA
MFDLNMAMWAIAIAAAFCIGFSKTGLPSMGILVVTIFSQLFPTKASVGILLPMLIVGDLFAVTYYRRSVVWKYLYTLIPWVLTGIIAGYFVLKFIENEQLQILLGLLILILIVFHFFRNTFENRLSADYAKSAWFSLVMGFLAGFATMVGNAAGGIMSVYLLSKGLPKKEFVGTGAWFYLAVNVIKVPFNVHLGLITWETLKFNGMLVPAIVGGALLGRYILPKIPEKWFQYIVLILAMIGAIRLILF